MSKETVVDCGIPVFEFYNSDNTAYNSAIFQDIRNSGSNNIFNILYQNGPETAGTYTLKLRAYYYHPNYQNNANNTIDSPNFVVKIIDPCDPPTLSLPTLTDQVRTITDASASYTFSPLFTVSPAFCEANVSISTSGAAATYVEFDEGSQTVTFP